MTIETPKEWNLDLDPLWKNALCELSSEEYGAVITVFDTDLDKYRVRRRRTSIGYEKVKAEYFEELDSAAEYMTSLTNLYDGSAENLEDLCGWLFKDSTRR